MLLDSYDAESEIIILSKNRDSHSIQLYLARFYASEEKPKNIFQPTSLQIKIKIHISCKVFFCNFFLFAFLSMDESLSKTISQYVHFAPENLAHKKTSIKYCIQQFQS